MKDSRLPKVQVVITPGHSGLMTKVIQQAIDSCAANGGGIVHFQAGTYLSGGIHLKSNVTLWLEKNTILQGSSTYSDYTNDAFIFGENLSSISIRGEGTIDGVDCFNPEGEEGFRGPHCIRLINCRNISLEGFTIKNSANWAINCRYCSKGKVSKVSIRGGHDGLHTRFCNNFVVSGCDFRTGDDAFAGNDNRDFEVTDCKINTSCNAFRFGCYNFTVNRCKLWGPGEFVHKIQKRNNMLAAFVHFSPKDENPKVLSGNWKIKEVEVDQVDHFYIYNFKNGLWQTGQPVTSVCFENIKATGLLNAFSINGDLERQFRMSVKNSIFSYREKTSANQVVFEGVESKSDAFFYAANFNRIDFKNVTLEKATNDVLFECESGEKVVFEKMYFRSDSILVPYRFVNLKKFKNETN
jgi:hypothetical protein